MAIALTWKALSSSLISPMMIGSLVTVTSAPAATTGSNAALTSRCIRSAPASPLEEAGDEQPVAEDDHLGIRQPDARQRLTVLGRRTPP